LKDTEIMELYWERDERAITETQNSYGRYCYSIAYNILHNREDSDECVNDTWLRAWNAMPPQKPNHLQLFLGTITRNLSFDVWKRKKAAKRGNGELELALDELMECVPAGKSTEELVEAAELSRLINVFVKSLPERECNVFLRRYWYVEDCGEIAKRYDMKVNTVKTTLFRVRRKLQEYLQQQGMML